MLSYLLFYENRLVRMSRTTLSDDSALYNVHGH